MTKTLTPIVYHKHIDHFRVGEANNTIHSYSKLVNVPIGITYREDLYPPRGCLVTPLGEQRLVLKVSNDGSCDMLYSRT